MNEIVLDRINYDRDDEFALELGRLLLTLTKNHHLAVVKYEDCDIYSIEHEDDRLEFGAEYPVWLTAEEREEVERNRQDD